MSLFTLLSTAVAVPMSVVFAGFIWFYIRARFAQRKKAKSRSNLESSRIANAHNQNIKEQSSFRQRITLKKVKVKPSDTVAINDLQHEVTETGVLQAISKTSPSLSNAHVSTNFISNSSDTLSYQPLSSYLRSHLKNDLASIIPDQSTIQFAVKDIPGINGAIEHELSELGYTSVEQIARWGRADVRAVSASLGVDQQVIEDEWIAGARLILSIR